MLDRINIGSLGLHAFERNTGGPHHLASKLGHPAKRLGDVSLTDFQASMWYGPMSVGTPDLTFTGQSPFLVHSAVVEINNIMHSTIRHGKQRFLPIRRFMWRNLPWSRVVQSQSQFHRAICREPSEPYLWLWFLGLR